MREWLLESFRSEIILLADSEVPEAESTTGIDLDELLSDDQPEPFTEERIERDIALQDIIVEVFESEEFDVAFAEGLNNSFTQLERSIQLESEDLLGDSGEIILDMRRLYQPLWLSLGADPDTASITQNEVPLDYGMLKIADRSTTIDFLWSLVQRGPDLRGLAIFGAIASFIGAVVIAERRPSRAIQFGTGLLGVGVVIIVVVFLVRFIVPLLATDSENASPVVATYASMTWPLVTTMIRLIILGLVIAAVGGLAKLIWPDDWVYSSVSDDRGVRSVRRRRTKKDAEDAATQAQPQQQQVAAAGQVAYPGYPAPYGAYPQQWGPQHYPGQPYQALPPGYGYPVGPYGQPQAPPQQYTSPGRPTVPVMPVQDELVAPAAPPLDGGPADLPEDAVQIVPRVVATTGDDDHDNTDHVANDDYHDDHDNDATAAVSTVVADTVDAEGGGFVEVDDADDIVDDEDDAWAGERDW